MLGTLIKKQITELFQGYVFNRKTNKMRSKASAAGMIVFFLVLFVGFLGFSFFMMASGLCGPLVQVGLGWLYFALMSLIALFLGIIGSVFSTYSSLYLAKDNDLLLSMPIPPKTIVASRAFGVLLMSLMFSGVVTVPAVVVYLITMGLTPARLVGGIVFILLVTAIVLALSCLLGYGVARLSLKLKNKSYITTAIALVFFALYYVVYFRLTEGLQSFIQNLEQNAEKISSSVRFLKVFGEVGEGKWPAVLASVALVALLCLLVWAVLIRSFTKIATTSAASGKAVYRETLAKDRTLRQTLGAREMTHFTSSSGYMLNCGLSTIMLILAGVALLWKGGPVITLLNQVFGEASGIVLVMLVGGISLIAFMNDTTVPSVSLEGRSLWIARSLPVETLDVLKAKLDLQLKLTVIPTLFCCICAGIALKPAPAEWVLLLAVPLLANILFALFGLMLGLRHVNLNWSNEIIVIKQSLSVLVYMLFGLVYGAAVVAVYMLFAWGLGPVWYLLIVAGVTCLLSFLLWSWIRTKGVRRFEEL